MLIMADGIPWSAWTYPLPLSRFLRIVIVVTGSIFCICFICNSGLFTFAKSVQLRGSQESDSYAYGDGIPFYASVSPSGA
jgi:hypothetical protein